MFICGIVFLVFRHDLMRFFTDDPRVLAYGGQFFICAAIFQLFDAMYITYSSALRGAGDTFVPALATGLTCWGMIVGAGWLVGFYFPQWGPVGPWAIATIYVFVIGLFMFIRFQRGGWKQIRLDETPTADKVSATEPVQVVTNEAPSPTTPGAH
jgi:MATE family multidrug resistance protein